MPVESSVSGCFSFTSGSETTHSFCNDRTVLLSQLFGSVFLLLSEVRELFDLCLVQAVDDWVLAFWHVDALDLLLVLEADLTGGHTAILLQVRPWGVDDCDVVLLVTCIAVSVSILCRVQSFVLTLDRVCFCQLSAVFQERLGNVLP